jgi:ABC-type sugar transport systems, ATPase components
MSKVTLKHVYKVYEGGVRAVNDFNLEIKDKEFIVFVGPSGCGKSTTLRMIAGLENITAGQLYIDDVLVNDMDSKDRDIAMVFQNYALYPHMTVFQNMAFGLKLRKEDPKEIEEKVNKAAEILEITDLLSRKPKALSGGQRQRVALGRAIVREPKVFLLDEPLSNLDAKLRVQMRTEITKLHKRLATTFIYVTHDQTEAMTMGDRIVVMKLGFIQQVDTPVNLYENPANLFVATFLGSPQMNIIPCILKEKDGVLTALLNSIDSLSLQFPPLKAKQLADSSYIGKPLFFGVRPEHIKIASEGIPATIDVVEQLGDETIVYAKIEGQEDDVIIKGVATGKYQAKDTIHLAIDMMQAHLFDQETTNSVMGVPRENTYPCTLEENAVVFGENRYEFSSHLKERLLAVAKEEKNLSISFAPEAVHLEEIPGGLHLAGKVDFVMEKTDSTTVFLQIPGCKKYAIFNVAPTSTIKAGDLLNIYVAEHDVILKDAEGTRLVSREVIMENSTKASFRTIKGKTTIRFGTNRVVMDGLNVPDGEHTIVLKEDKVRPILNKKQCKASGYVNGVYDKERTISVSAYDEDQLGKRNAAFLAVSGFDHYLTFLLDGAFSVYKAPKFALYLEDGAIAILD